jgi:arylsulfatase A-like enzyme
MTPLGPPHRRSALLLTALATLGAAAEPDPDPNETPDVAPALTQHVLVISVDGLRPDAIERYGAHTLTRLIEEGSASLAATTIMPSRTLPSHTSMLTGTEPDVHGVLWNEEDMEGHGFIDTPTIFAVAHAAGLRTAAFFGKAKFEHLAAPGTIDYAHFPRGFGPDLAHRTVDAAQAYLMDERPNLMFVHLADTDLAGHVLGWMGWAYGRAVDAVDREIGALIESADRAFGPGNYTMIVTADHGGHGHDHGTDDPRDVTIPWIAWGQGVPRGLTLPEGINTVDTAATTLALLGVEAPAMTGVPVTAAFPALRTARSAAATGR